MIGKGRGAIIQARLNDATLAPLPLGRAARLRRAAQSRPASCISASARSTARIRPSIPTTSSPTIRAGGSLARAFRAAHTRDALKPQDGLYTLAVRSGGGRAPARHRQRARRSGRAGEPGAPARGDGRSAHPHRVADRHRKRLLPRPGDRRAERSASRHRPRSRRAACAAHRARASSSRRCGAGARPGTPPFTVLTCDNLPSNGRVVKRILDRFAALRDPGPRRVRRRRARLPGDDGRPHNAGDDRRRPQAIAATLGVRRCVAGRDRAVLAMGDRGPFSRPAARAGRMRARSWSRTSSPTS